VAGASKQPTGHSYGFIGAGEVKAARDGVRTGLEFSMMVVNNNSMIPTENLELIGQPPRADTEDLARQQLEHATWLSVAHNTTSGL
jgi:hypothetical protein